MFLMDTKAIGRAGAPWSYEGSNFIYCIGGWAGSSANSTVDKHSLASDINAVDVGDDPSGGQNDGGMSSATYGYATGSYPYATSIRKVQFSSDTVSATGYHTGAGGLDGTGAFGHGGVSSEDHGYAFASGIIERFPFATDANSTDVGSLTNVKTLVGGYSANDGYGYAAGGGGPSVDVIQRFAIASTANASDIGVLTGGRENIGDGSGSDYGYSYKGGWPPTNIIDRFAYASSSNAIDIGDALESRAGCGGGSSKTHVYAHGGSTGGGSHTDFIEKVAQASTTSAADIANLYSSRYYLATAQY